MLLFAALPDKTKNSKKQNLFALIVSKKRSGTFYNSFAIRKKHIANLEFLFRIQIWTLQKLSQFLCKVRFLL